MPAVAYTAELARILALPRRAPEIAPALVAELTRLLKTPGGTMTLRPMQALALHDIGIVGGGLVPAGVGEGKTLTSFLAPYVLNAKRPVLLEPGALVHERERDRTDLAKHWRIPTNIRIMSYNILGLSHYADELERYQPDLIIADEAHRLKHKRAACTRRVARYMYNNPHTGFVGLTGTLLGPKVSLTDFAHILVWALKLNAPVPIVNEEIHQWASALDGFGIGELERMDPGALLQLCTPEELAKYRPLVAARHGFRRRLLETPGVVAAAGEGERVDAGIRIRGRFYDVKPVTDQHIAQLRKDRIAPDEWPVDRGTEVWAVVRQMALGLFYVWDPRPPPEWIAARREWTAFVREVLSHSRKLDTEKQVALACEEGRLDARALNAWRKIAPSYTPCVKPVWQDSSALEWCIKWMRRPGIVWTEHSFFAEELARLSGFPYYGAQGRTADGAFIGQADPTRSAIASIDANREGRNLQGIWSRALITAAPSAPDWWEQVIGRLHRPGQAAEVVEVDVLLGCREHYDACMKAIDGAGTVEELTGKAQKLLLADIELPSESTVSQLHSARWSK